MQWSTFDNSAKAGAHYAGVSPTWVEFEDGESFKVVHVDVLPNDDYNGTLEFGVYIDQKNAEGRQAGVMLQAVIIQCLGPCP